MYVRTKNDPAFLYITNSLLFYVHTYLLLWWFNWGWQISAKPDNYENADFDRDLQHYGYFCTSQF